MNVFKKFDRYFFGEIEDRDEDSKEVRPYFYTFLAVCFIAYAISLTIRFTL